MPVNFERAPILLFWETTRACKLACKHCRAEAIAQAMPGQLTTEESFRLIDDLRAFTPRFPVIVFTGGDPFMREDLFELAAHARSYGMPIGFAPSVTPLLTRETGADVEAGARAVSIGRRCGLHARGCRGVGGPLPQDRGRRPHARGEGHTVRSTAVMRRNVEELADVATLLRAGARTSGRSSS
jgi:MoaA/NifB/PqqE/SkfB family radical SAM enzyme